MDLFERVRDDDYEQVVFCHDRASGLRGIIAVHSTVLGPALGGTRFRPYPDTETALEDVLRLPKGMTYKSALARLDLGGGKAVILGDPATDKTEALLRAYGRHVDALGGRYVTAEDVGTTQADMDVVRRETRHVTGVSRSLGGSGDPSAATADGVLHAMRAVARHLWGAPALKGRHVVVSGVGKVGSQLARRLVEERARVTVSDVAPATVERVAGALGLDVVPADKAHAVECDIFSPCALGSALSAATIPDLRCAAVVGSANNQLADASCAAELQAAGVVYAPDYVVNAGGVIDIAEGLRGYDPERAATAVAGIFRTTAAVLALAGEQGVTTVEAADRLAERRIREVGAVRMIRRPVPTWDACP